ncbi:hypothetical protein I79_011989 [Cricetulus griseus]|uniref:Uncharacterized protein n=1 Tax=Cricetulus griseus TaxID=10029 RepID=G3HMM1_CRIGR|nr:hypothetical protein I79_011989 [Cricetulus griseus]
MEQSDSDICLSTHARFDSRIWLAEKHPELPSLYCVCHSALGVGFVFRVSCKSKRVMLPSQGGPSFDASDRHELNTPGRT